MDLIMSTSEPNDAIVCLLKAFGYANHTLPVAALLAKYHQLPGVWMVLSPIYWEATHNDAMMTQAGAASREIFDAFQIFVAEAGMRLHYHDAYTWLLQCDAEALPETKPLHLVLNQSMRPMLKALETEPFWLRFLTEAQMFLSRSQCKINGVWFWGAGACHAREDKPLIIYGDKAWCAAGELLSTQVSLYHDDMIFSKHSVCFVPEYMGDQLDKLKAKFEKQKPKSFWKRLWSQKK